MSAELQTSAVSGGACLDLVVPKLRFGFVQQADLYIVIPGANVRICRVADLDCDRAGSTSWPSRTPWGRGRRASRCGPIRWPIGDRTVVARISPWRRSMM